MPLILPRWILPAAVLLAWAGGGAAARADDTPPAAAPDAGAPGATAPEAARWIFAAEDTLKIPAFFEMSEIEIRADRLQIGDIVQRCIDREQELAERIESHEYTLIARTVLSIGGEGDRAKRRMVVEQADRKFYRKPDQERTIPLKLDKYRLEDGERKEWELDDDDDPAIQVSYGDLTDLPFYLEDRDQYDFEILSREIVGDRVIYEVRLTPKSDFEIAPAGRIWVETSSFSILREEFDFGDRVPLPMIIKHVGPFIRERERVGDLWVWKRFLIRVDIRGKFYRWLDRDIPDVAEFVILFQDHRVNEGWSTDESDAARDAGPAGGDG